MKLNILYEDIHMIVVEKPAGMESQASKSFEPDMVSEIRRHIHKTSTSLSTLSSKNCGEPYVGVVHRLDKPVSGILVYGKNQKAAGALSKQIQNHEMRKRYGAVVCGKPVDNCGTYVDYLWKDGKSNTSKIVDKQSPGGKVAELSYRIVDTVEDGGNLYSLAEILLKTGRHHQIRVQMAGHGTPLWGDRKYNPAGAALWGKDNPALCAMGLSLKHPVTGKTMTFAITPTGGGFSLFPASVIEQMMSDQNWI